jgi:hypothetical protein
MNIIGEDRTHIMTRAYMKCNLSYLSLWRPFWFAHNSHRIWERIPRQANTFQGNKLLGVL